jgi:hypothetical protein
MGWAWGPAVRPATTAAKAIRAASVPAAFLQFCVCFMSFSWLSVVSQLLKK